MKGSLANSVCFMNNVYVYSGNFADLLDLVFFLITTKRKPFDIVREQDVEIRLLEERIRPIYQEVNTKKKWDKIVGRENTFLCQMAFRSTYTHKELAIYYYLLNALKYREHTKDMRQLKCVNKILELAHYVRHETHKMKGFLRFKEMKNQWLYAEMEPENDILELLVPHFKKRLAEEYWVIKDVKRGLFAFYDRKNVRIFSDNEVRQLDILEDETEKQIEKLWQTFFRTIAISERKNLRCQQNFMPKKYWKYLIEMEDTNEENT